MKTKIHKQHDGDCTIYSTMINNFCTDGICTCGFGHEYKYTNKGSWKHLFSKERLTWMKKKAEKVWRRSGPNARKKAEKLLKAVFSGKKPSPLKE